VYFAARPTDRRPVSVFGRAPERDGCQHSPDTGDLAGPAR
jgi:hypothetical protein